MNVEVVRRMFAGVDAKADVDGYCTFFAPDATYRAGNADAVMGHDGIKGFAAPMVATFSAVQHEVCDVWEVEKDVVVAELMVTYTRKDGKVTRVPCLDVIRFQDGKVKSLQAYLDASPAFS
jgi:ketosteroid isomerase-like protein